MSIPDREAVRQFMGLGIHAPCQEQIEPNIFVGAVRSFRLGFDRR